MRTPREILLERHQAAQPQLEAIRRATLATLARQETPQMSTTGAPAQAASGYGLGRSIQPAWHEVLCSVRWQLATLGAAWAVIALLNLSASEALSSTRAEIKALSERQLLLALREHRQQLRELIDAPNEPAPPPSTPIPAPRSENLSTFGIPS